MRTQTKTVRRAGGGDAYTERSAKRPVRCAGLAHAHALDVAHRTQDEQLGSHGVDLSDVDDIKGLPIRKDPRASWQSAMPFPDESCLATFFQIRVGAIQ